MMKKIVILMLLLCSAAGASAKAKPFKKLNVTVDAAGYHRTNTIASLDMTPYELEGQTIVVKQLTDSGSKPCISQMDVTKDGKKLYWRIDGEMTDNQTSSFEIEAVPAAATDQTLMQITKDKNGALVLSRGNVPVLAYNTKMSRLPHGVDPAYSRNGYIHPAWSPSGYVLTDVNPSDHAHHYGFWNPWTSVDYDGAHYDNWNLGSKTGTVLLDSVVKTTAGDLFADLLVAHDHIIFQKQPERTYDTVAETLKVTPKKRITILDELLDIRVWNIDDKMFVWDFVSTQTPATELPVVLPAYRYGGFCWRANPEFGAQNVRMLSSEGKDRSAIDASKARWILTTAETEKGTVGVMMMSYPENHAYPEPLRIWDAKESGGKVMVNYAPSKLESWTMEPGNDYQLKYRVVTFDKNISPIEAERLWQEFAHPVKVTVK